MYCMGNEKICIVIYRYSSNILIFYSNVKVSLPGRQSLGLDQALNSPANRESGFHDEFETSDNRV